MVQVDQKVLAVPRTQLVRLVLPGHRSLEVQLDPLVPVDFLLVLLVP